MTTPTTTRQEAEAILLAAVAAAEPGPLVRRAMEAAPELAGTRAIRLLAIGKAAPAMASAALELLGNRVRDSVIIAPAGTYSELPVLYGAHPLPDDSSVRAGSAARRLLLDARVDELVLVLLSGGASAAAVLPLGDITVREYADCIDRLMRAGTDIVGLNTVRRHIDGLKGGRAAALAAPADVLGIVLSDVVHDPPGVIASGPLSPDPTTAADALAVLRARGALDDCAPSIRAVLDRASSGGDAHAPPPPDDPLFGRVRVRIAGGNDVAVNGAADRAEALGYRVRRATEPVTGPAREAGATLAREARALQEDGRLPVCIVAGGETTVSVTGDGRGGRNQEIVLAACIELDGVPGITVGSIATDGVDGPTDAAGAVADADTMRRAGELDIDARTALERNDSHTFFSATGGLIVTGPTGTNVNDVQIALITGPALPELPE